MKNSVHFLSYHLNYCDSFSKNSSNFKFHENPFSRNPVVPSGRTDMTMLIVAFRNFENRPKQGFIIPKCNTRN